MRPEVITILKALVNKDQSAIAMEKKTLDMLIGRQNLIPFTEYLENEIKKTKDSRDDRVPFLNFYLAVIQLKQNHIAKAKDALSDALIGFQILGWTLNEALSEWLFTTIHFENEDYDRAQRACSAAITTLRELIRTFAWSEKMIAYGDDNQAAVR